MKRILTLSVLSVIFVMCMWIPSSESALSGTSIILVLDRAKPSIVEIRAENISLRRGGSKQAYIDKNTGKIMISGNVIAGSLSRTGSGVIIDSNGTIATNAHIIIEATAISVKLRNGTEYNAYPLAVVPGEDIAFLKIDAGYPLKAIGIADSENARLRQTVYTVGSSEVLSGTVSEGEITGLGRMNDSPRKRKVDIIQTNFNIYKGDSGGPVFDGEGRLLGIMVATRTEQNATSYAIASDKIMDLYRKYVLNKE